MQRPFAKNIIFYSVLLAANAVFSGLLLLMQSAPSGGVGSDLDFIFGLMPIIIGGNILIGYAFFNYKKITTFQNTNIVSIIMFSSYAIVFEIYTTGDIYIGQGIAAVMGLIGIFLFVGDKPKVK